MSNVADKLRDLARDNTEFSDKLKELAQEIEGPLYGVKDFPGGQSFSFKFDPADNTVLVETSGWWFRPRTLEMLIDHLKEIKDDLERRD